MKNSRFMRGISAFLAFALVLESVAFAVPTQRDEHERNSLRRLEEEVQFSSVRHIFSRHLPDHEQPSEAELAFRQRDLAIWLQFQTQGEPLKRAMFRLLGQRLGSTLHHPARVDALWGAGTAARQNNQNHGPYHTPANLMTNEAEGHVVSAEAERSAAMARIQSQSIQNHRPRASRFFTNFKRNISKWAAASVLLSFLGIGAETMYKDREYAGYFEMDWTDRASLQYQGLRDYGYRFEDLHLANFESAPLWAQASLLETKNTILASADYLAFKQFVAQEEIIQETLNNIRNQHEQRAYALSGDAALNGVFAEAYRNDPIVAALNMQQHELFSQIAMSEENLATSIHNEIAKLDGLAPAAYLQFLFALSFSLFGFVSFSMLAYGAALSTVDRHQSKALAKSMLEALEFGYREGCEQLGIAHDQTISRALRAGTMDLSLATLPMAAASSVACEELLKSQAVQQAVPANRVRVEAAAAESAPATISTQTQEHEVAVEVEALAER